MTPVETLTPLRSEQGLGAELPAFVSRIQLRASRVVAWMRAHWALGCGAGNPMVILDDEVDRSLAGASSLSRSDFYQRDRAIRNQTEKVITADHAVAQDPHVTAFQRALALTPAEIDLLTLTAAIELQPSLGRLFGYLHDDAIRYQPTPWLARQLFDWPSDIHIGPNSGLVRWRLAGPLPDQDNPWSQHAAWAVDPHVAFCLCHGPSTDPLLTAATEIIQANHGATHDCLYREQLELTVSFVRSMMGCGKPIEIALVGAVGAGKQTLARQVCQQLGVPLLVVDWTALLNSGVLAGKVEEASVRVARLARLRGAVTYWDAGEPARVAVWRNLAAHCEVSFVGSDAANPAPQVGGEVRRVVRLPPLTRADRERLWSALSDKPPPRQVRDWSLLPADIVRAAAVAHAGSDAVLDACRPTLPPESSSVAAPLPRPYQWSDLVVNESTRQHLAEFEAQARLRWSVYEDWGFGRICPMGRGIAALFSGPSGTGKTMAAQIVARALDMEIYRVDLAGVVSKYIGETEKRLREVFDTSERSNVLLFFDEADALFGRRTQVVDAHDRFANIEIDYLLQRMEQFDGIAILATNRRSDIDNAFLRRVRFIVDFLPPGVEERRQLWRRALPTHTPAGEQLLDAIDWDILAEKLDLTGADIKAAGIGAAFLARAENTMVGMRHVLHAARREMAKRGSVLRAGELGE